MPEPDANLMGSAEGEDDVVQECTYENQRFYPGIGFSSSLLPTDRLWLTADGSNELRREDVELPSLAWQWEGDWYIDNDLNGEPLEEEGWMYAFDFPWGYHTEMGRECYVRRRKWIRHRRYVGGLNALEAVPMLHEDAEDITLDPGLSGGQQAAIAAGAATAAGGVAGAGVVVGVPAALGAVGFSSTGVVAGSAAAAIQSAVYGGSVAAGSSFATAQSVAMGGVALGPIGAIVGLSVAGLIGAGVGIGFAVKNYKDKKRAKADAASARDNLRHVEAFVKLLVALLMMAVLGVADIYVRMCINVHLHAHLHLHIGA